MCDEVYDEFRADAKQPCAVGVPDGWTIELGFDVIDRQFRFVDTKTHLPTIKITLPACEVDDMLVWDLRDYIADQIKVLLTVSKDTHHFNEE